MQSLAEEVCKASIYLDPLTKAKIVIGISHDLPIHISSIITNLIKSNRCGRAEIITIPYPFEEKQMPKDFLEMYEKALNCCGWREYIRLSLWGLTQYKRIIYMDIDAVFGVQANPDFLFQCDDVDMLYTPGPYSSLNAGMLLITPRKDVHQSMINEVRHFNFSRTTGWSGTGGGTHIFGMWELLDHSHYNRYAIGEPLLHSISMDGYDIRKDSINLFSSVEKVNSMPNFIKTRSYHGIEGPQGFLHYYFVLKPRLARKPNDPKVKAKKLISCLYNYQGNCLYCRERYWRVPPNPNNKLDLRKPLVFHKGITVSNTTGELEAPCFTFPKD